MAADDNLLKVTVLRFYYGLNTTPEPAESVPHCVPRRFSNTSLILAASSALPFLSTAPTHGNPWNCNWGIRR